MCEIVGWKQCLPFVIKSCKQAGIKLWKERKVGQTVSTTKDPADRHVSHRGEARPSGFFVSFFGLSFLVVGFLAVATFVAAAAALVSFAAEVSLVPG
jgi:hypothetical protein